MLRSLADLRRLVAVALIGVLMLSSWQSMPAAAAEPAYTDLAADVARGEPVSVTTRGGRTVSHRPLTTVIAPDGHEAVADRLIIGLASGLSATEKVQLHQRAAGRASVSLRSLARIADDVEVVNLVGPASLAAAIQAYRADPRVLFADPDHIVRASEVPNDLLFGSQWGMTKIEAPAAWDVTHGSSSVIVAVLDTGVYEAGSSIPNGFPGHPDLNGRVVSRMNFTGEPTGSDDYQGHGTHVAGTVSAITNNSVGVAGVGYNTSLANVKVLGDTGSGLSSWTQAGIRWAADNGARVINMSLGSVTSTCSSSYQSAVNYAWALNVVIVAAAGNSGVNGVDQPANCPLVLAVASTTSSDARSSFSNYGKRVHLAAPGSDILSTDYLGSYATLSGTSMATPHVAGLAGLLWSRSGMTSNWQVVNQLKLSADRIAGTGTLWQSGRINAQSAVSETIRGASAWYFAEGYTGPGFDEYLTIQNPGGSATATITYFVEGSTPVVRSVALPAASRVTVAVHDAYHPSANPGGLGRLSVGHSTRVETSKPVVVERPMYFTYGGSITGGHNVMGVTAPSALWYFAEGYTGPGFDEYLTIQNPNPTATTASITYFLEGGPTHSRSVPLPGNSRTTVRVHEAFDAVSNPGGLGRLTVGHSTQVTTGLPTVIERPMYFAYNGAITGGHIVAGANTGQSTWFFAEGYTGSGFDEYLTIQNGNAAPATATITYYLESGSTVVRSVTLPSSSRTTVRVHDAFDAVTNPGGLGRLSVGHSTRIDTSLHTIIERPMYFIYGGSIKGGHNVIGSASAAYAWYLAEGYTGTGFDEYLTIANPTATATTVTITYYRADSPTPVVKQLDVPANRRVTVAVHDSSGPGLGRLSAGHSTSVESLAAPVIVERPMYFNFNGIRDGHNVMGYRP